MIELASENGAVMAADGAQTLVRAGLDRMQLENDLENVAKRCETLHSPESETCQSTPAIESPPDEDETYATEETACSSDGCEFHVSESLLRKVSARQLLALHALACGDDLHEVAKVAKVHRSTLFRWLKYDANFQEELAAQQRAMYGAAMSRGIVAAGDAMDQVVSAVAQGDLNAAIRLLKGLGLFNGRRPDFHYVGEQPTDQPAAH